ncbi:M14 family metallopeptidase [candidate division KSB1 bacterium]
MSILSSRISPYTAYALFYLFVFPFASGTAQQAGPAISGLGSLFEEGYILQDVNADSVIDNVTVRILVPPDPSEAEITAAANIAARLGYETSGMDLDLLDTVSGERGQYDLPVILVGDSPSFTSWSDEPPDPLKLAPGQGTLYYIEPNETFRKGAVHLSGADASGLLAAADYFAGRYPDIWKLREKKIADVRGQFSKFFAQREISYESLKVIRIVSDAGKPGLIRLTLGLVCSDHSSYTRSIGELTEKDKQQSTEDELSLNDLEFSDVHQIAVSVSGPDESRIVYLDPEKQWNTGAADSKAANPSKSFPLWQLYTINGLFSDTNQDFVPDAIPAYIAMSGTGNAEDLADLAARIGLESAGLSIPLVRVAGTEEHPEEKGFPVLYGTDHHKIQRLTEAQKLYGIDDYPESGYIQFVAKEFGDKNGVVISARDPEGLSAVSAYVAKRLPYLWDYGKGNFLLSDIEEDVRDFFQVREAPGQVVLALYKLGQWLERLENKELESVSVEIAAKDVPQGLDNYAAEYIRRYFPEAVVEAETFRTGFGLGKTVFEEEFDIPWEVDELWRRLRNEVLPEIRENSTGFVRIMVSESPEVRRELQSRIFGEIRSRGASQDKFNVTVLSAYKQGYSWLYDEILPQISNTDVGRIEIAYHTLEDSEEIRWQTISADTRWLQEIYPIDAVLARELAIPDSLITFHPTKNADPVYTVTVFDKRNNAVFEDSFSPKYVVRPFFDLFPEYESVRVTTGWISAVLDGQPVLDERIKTDPERFWDHLQTVTYRKIIDYVMDIQDGRPSSDHAPYFDEFTVNLTLSEPNYRIGIDEEVVSSLEALHEDIYFETLTLFNLIGGRYNAGSMNYPGRILPYINPPVDGVPGKAKITLTGKDRGMPQLILTYTEAGKEPQRQRYDLDALGVPDPMLTGIWVEPGRQEITRLMFEVTATDSVDRYEEYKMRSSERSIDNTFIAAAKLTDMTGILRNLQEAGMFEDALSYDKVGNMFFRVVIEDDSTGYAAYSDVPRSSNPKDTENPRPVPAAGAGTSGQLVQWESPIGPEEAERIVARLNDYPNIRAYYMATSLLGQNVFAMDLYPPYETQFVSQAKLNALKPTLVISGRQHANEVSSTSHILRLAELTATDPVYSEYLRKVSLVLHPITNIDGARLAMDLHKINPDFMLHAGYLGPLGVDVDSDARNANPRYPESRVRGILRETWLPDVFLNPHGYPSHEWVQFFAGYSAWVRNRSGGQRSWWSPRGWFVPGFNWIEDSEFPDHKTAQFALLDAITGAVAGLPDVMDMNNRMYRLYRKYGIQDRENFREYFHNGILVNAGLRGRKLSGSGITSPKITYFSLTTEAPDEIARGDWLKLVSSAGLAHTTAVLKYLYEGVNTIEHQADEYQDRVTRSVSRKKPVVPPKPSGKENK